VNKHITEWTFLMLSLCAVFITVWQWTMRCFKCWGMFKLVFIRTFLHWY